MFSDEDLLPTLAARVGKASVLSLIFDKVIFVVFMHMQYRVRLTQRVAVSLYSCLLIFLYILSSHFELGKLKFSSVEVNLRSHKTFSILNCADNSNSGYMRSSSHVLVSSQRLTGTPARCFDYY